MKIAVAGKGGIGKTALSAALAVELAARERRTLAVDCDPNPNLAESVGHDSAGLARFTFDDLRREGSTLALAVEPELVEIEPGRLWLLGGPPGPTPLNDAVARGLAGVLLADRFDDVVTDLGAGPEFARLAVGGALNPADVCLVLSNGSPAARLAAERIEAACDARRVASRRIEVDAEGPAALVPALADALLA